MKKKIKYTLKIPYVINHIITKIKIIIFLIRKLVKVCVKKVKYKIFVDEESIDEVLWIEKYFLLMGTSRYNLRIGRLSVYPTNL
jgi:hypothetical protein